MGDREPKIAVWIVQEQRNIPIYFQGNKMLFLFIGLHHIAIEQSFKINK